MGHLLAFNRPTDEPDDLVSLGTVREVGTMNERCPSCRHGAKNHYLADHATGPEIVCDLCDCRNFGEQDG